MATATGTETTYVALLRGINVGGNNTISMKALKALFEHLGYSNVRTYINSGNVMFTADEAREELVPRIERGIKEEFGFDIPVVVRSKREVEAVCRKVPQEWVNDASMRTDVLFLWDEVDSKRVLAEIETNPAVDTLVYTKGAVIWNIDRARYKESKLHKFIGTRVYKSMTARNVNTVRKLQGLMSNV